jgi:hypothetical protein
LARRPTRLGAAHASHSSTSYSSTSHGSTSHGSATGLGRLAVLAVVAALVVKGLVVWIGDAGSAALLSGRAPPVSRAVGPVRSGTSRRR